MLKKTIKAIFKASVILIFFASCQKELEVDKIPEYRF